jgi:hypothetical protein
MAYIPYGFIYQLMKPIGARDGGLGWTKVAAGAGRENGGRRKKEESGGRKGQVLYKRQGCLPVGTLLVLQGAREVGALPGNPGCSTRVPRCWDK